MFTKTELEMMDTFLRNGGDSQEVLELVAKRLEEQGFEVELNA